MMRKFTLLILFSVLISTLKAQIVTRGPYLQKASHTSMTIKWRTNTPTISRIEYGTSINNLNQVANDLTERTEHEVTILSLNPATVYYYQISDLRNPIVPASNDLYFKTHPIPGTAADVKMWILGDCGTANNNQRNVRDAYYNYIGNNHTDAILFLGDNAYNSGTDAEYQDAVFENMYEDKLKNSVAWSTLGNHDGYTADSDSQTGPYYDIFSFPTKGESGGVPSGTEAYYSFDYGNIHFICLESYETDRNLGGAMYNWALSDIQNTTADWIVAYWHHPAYSKGSHDSDTENVLIQMRQNFLPMLEENGVDLVLAGHSHSYERSYFLNGHYGNSNSFNPSTNTVGTNGHGNGRTNGNGAYSKMLNGENGGEGAVYITTGSAGKVSSGSLDHEAMFYSVSNLGSCVLEISGEKMDVKFVRENGNIDDYFTINKSKINCTPGATCDDGNPNTTGEIYDENCICVGPVVDAEVCEIINSSNDDVEQSSQFGFMNFTSTEIDIVVDSLNENIIGNSTVDIQRVGLRFNDIVVPQGATVSNAYIQFTTSNVDAGTANITIEGVAVDNMEPFSTNSYTLQNLSKTNTSSSWIPAPWNIIGESGVNQRTSDITNIITEIINRPGYKKNNSMAMVLTGTGRRIAESYDGNSSSAPRLCITYSAPLDCPNLGQSCNDGDPCTINDIYNSECNCEGTYSDSDFDGVCDSNDLCAGIEPGQPCNDGDPCTFNDVVNSNCNCQGTYSDSDSDGVCDGDDFCPGFNNNLIGTSCNDGNACTENDVWTSSCNCVGTYTDSDSDGVCDANDLCFGPEPGLTCNDNDACTVNDRIDANCNCVGTYQDSDNDGVCDVNDDCPNFDDNLIGQTCNDGNPCTVNDRYSTNCNCEGVLMDSDNDGICDNDDQCNGPDPGMACNDGDPCTVNDVIGNDCNCSGKYIDSDNDGICDPQDSCPNLVNNLIGTTCDDGDPDTFNDTYTSNCICEGISTNVTICTRVSHGDDDAEQNVNIGTVNLNSTDLELINDANNNGGDQVVGIRFANVDVPQGATITSAYIQFTTDEKSTGSTSLTIRGQASDNPPSFNTSWTNISSRPITNSSVSWSPPTWNSEGESGAKQRTPDLSNVITEIVNRPGYNQNNSMIILITGSGKRTAESHNGSPNQAPELCITYSQGCSTAGATCDDNNPCTTNDVLDNTCNCIGTLQPDSDNDGICDPQDNCPNFNNNLIGTTCDDSDPCTTGDVYDNDCNCIGTPTTDSDNDGICDAEDTCPNFNDNLIGTTCDDGNPCTTGATYDSDCNCSGGFDICSGVATKVFAKFYLEGFYNGDGSMHNDLKQGNLLPLNQPYNTAPWNYSGTESLDDVPYSHVDWILVVVRDANGIIVGQAAGFVNIFGDIIDADGTFGIAVNNAVGNYISIHHRSHLAVISKYPYGNGTYDFTLSDTQVQGTDQMRLIDGIYMLYAGDYDGTGVINSSDFNNWIVQGAAINQYIPIDGDGNGIVNSLDYNLWINNRSKVGHPFVRY